MRGGGGERGILFFTFLGGKCSHVQDECGTFFSSVLALEALLSPSHAYLPKHRRRTEVNTARSKLSLSLSDAITRWALPQPPPLRILQPPPPPPRPAQERELEARGWAEAAVLVSLTFPFWKLRLEDVCACVMEESGSCSLTHSPSSSSLSVR